MLRSASEQCARESRDHRCGVAPSSVAWLWLWTAYIVTLLQRLLSNTSTWRRLVDSPRLHLTEEQMHSGRLQISDNSGSRSTSESQTLVSDAAAQQQARTARAATQRQRGAAPCTRSSHIQRGTICSRCVDVLLTCNKTHHADTDGHRNLSRIAAALSCWMMSLSERCHVGPVDSRVRY